MSAKKVFDPCAAYVNKNCFMREAGPDMLGSDFMGKFYCGSFFDDDGTRMLIDEYGQTFVDEKYMRGAKMVAEEYGDRPGFSLEKSIVCGWVFYGFYIEADGTKMLIDEDCEITSEAKLIASADRDAEILRNY